MQGGFQVELDQIVIGKMTEAYVRLLQKTAALVEQHWPAIMRVGKHLERHGRINNQAELDDLIARAERLSSS